MSILKHRLNRRMALLVTLGAIATPTAIATVGSGDEPKSGVPGSEVAQPSAATPSVKNRFAIFRASAQATDRPTIGTHAGAAAGQRLADIDAGYAKSTGMNLALARRVSADKRAFAVPGQGVVCLVQDTGSASCTPDEHVGGDFQVQTCTPDGKLAVFGLVADNARRGVLRLKGGGAAETLVRRNYLEVTVNPTNADEVPVAVELVDKEGARQSYPIPVIEFSQLGCDTK